MSSVPDDGQQSKERAVEAPGKRLLMEAALRLSSQSRSLSSLGLRELAREAGSTRTPSIAISRTWTTWAWR